MLAALSTVADSADAAPAAPGDGPSPSDLPLPAAATIAIATVHEKKAAESSRVTMSGRDDNGDGVEEKGQEEEQEEEHVDGVMDEIHHLDAAQDTTVFASPKPASRTGGGLKHTGTPATTVATTAAAATRPSRERGGSSSSSDDGEPASPESSAIAGRGDGVHLPLRRGSSANPSRFGAGVEEENNSNEGDEGLSELQDVDWAKSPRPTVAPAQ